MVQEDSDIKAVKEIVLSFQKARKNLRLYPANNPIYAATVENVHKRLYAFLQEHGSLDLRIGKNEIFFSDEPVYQSVGKEENLALLFFRDGLRELVFSKDIDREELRGFLEILSYDFESEDVEEDVVTLMWGRDFQNIRYVVEDTVFSDEEDGYEAEAVRRAKESSPPDDELEKVYADALREEAVSEHYRIAPVSDKDLTELADIVKKEAGDKQRKLIDILFEMLTAAESREEFIDITHIANEVMEYCITRNDFESAVDMLRLLRRLGDALPPSDERRKHLGVVIWYAGTPGLIKTIGELLDAEAVDEPLFKEYAGFLEKNAIQPLMNMLGGLKSISARKMLIEALVSIGRKDLSALAAGLRDERWYMVRNIIYVLRKIGDRQAAEYLMKAARHADARVRKEVVVALGELGGPNITGTLREYLDDPEPAVRITAARALGKTASELAKNALIAKVSGREFREVDFNEKKEYFEVLAAFRDRGVADRLMTMLRRTAIFRRARNNEMKACAAYGLGLMGVKDALPALEKMRRSKNKLLSDYAYGAIKRISYGR